jgi:hypothetical protein
VEIGRSWNIDDFNLEELKKYPLVVITGAHWKSKDRAEKLIVDYARSGGRVIVDFTGFPVDVLSKQPLFLDVYGEPVTLRTRLSISGGDETISLKPFAQEFELWKCYIPQKLDGMEYGFDYYGSKAAILGYRDIGGARVWFLGGNPIYHAFLTGDPTARELLRQFLRLPPGEKLPEVIPLDEYQTTEQGYAMSYSLPSSREVVIPVAALDGYQVRVDGKPVAYRTFENLICLNLPAGDHRISIELEATPVYQLGQRISLLSLILIALWYGFIRLREGRRRQFETAVS